MQLNDLQVLVSKLKENTGMQVESTTLGRFLGPRGSYISDVLGREILTRPVIISKKEDSIQILDLKKGFVVPVSDESEIVPAIIKVYSKTPTASERARELNQGVESTVELYRKVITKEIDGNPISQTLSEFHTIMSRPGSNQDRLALVEKTIDFLEVHKGERVGEEELSKICKAQDKLGKMAKHIKSGKLAPGQIPSVFELAVWSWVN